jgi:flagellar motor switch protein FliN/FliY
VKAGDPAKRRKITMADETENQAAESTAAPDAATGAATAPSKVTAENLRVLENVEVQMTVEVGNTEIKIRDLLRLNEGAVIELDRLAGDPLDILVNGTMIAKGEIVMVGERFGVRFTEIVDPEKRVENL